MIATANDIFAGLPAWTPPSQLTQLTEPPHQALARFIHGCSPDPAIRTASTTALVLSFWQLRGINLATRVPSLLLVQPEEAGNDPIDSLVKELVYNEEDNKPRVQKTGTFMHGSIDLARRVMANRYGLRQSIRPIPGDGPMTDLQQLEARNAEEKFHAASITAHGFGYCRPYAEAWHADYGLLTDQDGKIILRLNTDKDRDALLDDVGNNPAKLVFPQGVGRHLFPVDKSVCLSGAVTLPQARKAIRLVELWPAAFPAAASGWRAPEDREQSRSSGLGTHMAARSRHSRAHISAATGIGLGVHLPQCPAQAAGGAALRARVCHPAGDPSTGWCL